MAIPVNTKVIVGGQDTATRSSSNGTRKGFKAFTMATDDQSLKFAMRTSETAYSDITTAVIREYSTNARDSHIEAGIKLPISVTSPTKDDPNLIIEDFGTGMSVDFLENQFTQFYGSTKRKNALANGQIGIGRMVALGEVNAFVIESIQNGKKAIARISKNDEGISGIEILSVTKTRQGNGTKVIVNVGTYKVEDYCEKIKSFFYLWPKEDVLVDNEPVYNIYDDAMHHVEGFGHIANNSRYGEAKLKIVMGDIAYDVNGLTSRQRQTIFEDFPQLQNRHVYLDMPLGSLEFPASREAVINHSTNLAKIARRVVEMKNYIVNNAEKELNRVTDPYEAMLTRESMDFLIGKQNLLHKDFLLDYTLLPEDRYEFTKSGVRKSWSQNHWSIEHGLDLTSGFENVNYIVFSSDDHENGEYGKGLSNLGYYHREILKNIKMEAIFVTEEQYTLDCAQPLFNSFVEREKISIIKLSELNEQVKNLKKLKRSMAPRRFASGGNVYSEQPRGEMKYDFLLGSESHGSPLSINSVIESGISKIYVLRVSMDQVYEGKASRSMRNLVNLFPDVAKGEEAILFLNNKSLEYFTKRLHKANGENITITTSTDDLIERVAKSYKEFKPEDAFYLNPRSEILNFVEVAKKMNLESTFWSDISKRIEKVESINKTNLSIHSIVGDTVPFPETYQMPIADKEEKTKEIFAHYGSLAPMMLFIEHWQNRSMLIPVTLDMLEAEMNKHYAEFGDPKIEL